MNTKTFKNIALAFHYLVFAAALFAPFASVRGQSSVSRKDFFITSDPGIRIHVREVRFARALRAPVLLLHGGGGAGVASFDVPVPGFSLAEDIARAGHPVYVMDVRGYGDSTKPLALDDPSPNAAPAGTAEEAVKDIDAVVNEIRRRNKGKRVAVFGWASGGHWLGLYTARNNAKVSHFIMLNAIYGVNAPWPLREFFADDEQPEIFNRKAGAYRLANAQVLVASWENAIPVKNKDEWRDPRVAQFYVEKTLASDPTANDRMPPSVRIPRAFQREAFDMSLGRKLYDAADIRVPTLVIRSGLDHWTRPEDLAAIEKDLINAPRKRIVTIPNATHLVFLDRPDRGRKQLIDEILRFLH
ncbi:MAG: alpha/beta fold hydrolase [Acidobacteria bacterium]|nr:alpha/beta fold hydrolase [Acidobacteriota bacterium]